MANAKRIDDDVIDVTREKDMRPVVLPTGNVYHVYKDEVDEFNSKVKRYEADNYLTNESDKSTLDRIVMFEHLVQRWAIWLSKGYNYWSDPIDEIDLQNQMQKTSTEIRRLKNELSIDKTSRDKQKGTENWADYIRNLGIRAKHWDIKRDTERDWIMEKFMTLRAKFQLYENTLADERTEQKSNYEDIHKWWNEEVLPKYDEIDRVFVEDTPTGLPIDEEQALAGGQKTWAVENSV